MKRTISIALLLLAVQAGAQSYWVFLADKPNYRQGVNWEKVDFLSPRAIERRQMQGIELDPTDWPVHSDYINEIEGMGYEMVGVSRWLNAAIVRRNDQELDALKSLPFVKEVKEVRRMKTVPKEEPSYSFTEKMNFSQSEYGDAWNQIHMLHGEDLHNQGFRGEGMVIAVLDAGYTNTNNLPVFQNMFAEGRFLGGWDFVNGNDSIFGHHPHGTYVLSCMTAELPGVMIGTAPKASYWLIRTEDAATEQLIEEYYWLLGAEFADSVGADIINSSLGYTEFDGGIGNHTYADMNGTTTIVSQAANTAADKGILVVNAVGNYGQVAWRYLIAPADAQGVLAVGGVNAKGEYAKFSSHGPSADGRIKPNVAAQAEGTFVAATTGGTFSGNGTSFSSPIVAGMAACLWQSRKQVSNWEIMFAIQKSAHQISRPDSLLGYGIPNFALAHEIFDEVILNLDFPEINLFPIPARRELNVLLNERPKNSISIAVYSSNGSVVYADEMPSQFFFTIPFSPAWAQGTYILELRLDENVIRERFLIQRP
jgi:hypothetical protein